MLAESPAPTGLKAYLLSAWSIVCLILYHLAIIFPRRLRPANDRPIHELHPTAYLDALRGYAAWIVYNFHIIRWEWQPQTFPARLFFKGVAMVDVFFVISGFALSYSIIGAIHRAAVETKTNNKKNYNKVLENLAGSVFRRYIRLYLPVTFASFVGFLVAATGIGIPPPGNGPQKLAPTFLENFRWWALDTLRCSDPFAHVTGWISGGLWPKWLEQFWTIPVEYRGSMLVYVLCAMSCYMKPWSRTTLIWFGMAAALWWQAPFGTLFLAGMWLSDQRHWRAAQESLKMSTLPTTAPTEMTAVTEATPLTTLEEKYEDEESKEEIDSEVEDGRNSLGSASTLVPSSMEQDIKSEIQPRPSRWRRCWPSKPRSSSDKPTTPPSLLLQLLFETPYILLFLFSLWLFAGPRLCKPDSQFPFNLLYYTMPPNYDPAGLEHWHLVIGAIMNVYALEHSAILRRPLLCSFSQFMGELSFGIYAMHITIRWIFWDRAFIPWQIAYFGKQAGSFHAFLPGYFVMFVLLLWAAELFRRVDGWCVKFSKRVKDWVFVG